MLAIGVTNDIIKNKVLKLIDQFPIRKITLFGSRASGTNREDSDVDLIMEFSTPISILTLSQIRCELEDEIGLPVDLIHGPIRGGRHDRGWTGGRTVCSIEIKYVYKKS